MRDLAVYLLSITFISVILFLVLGKASERYHEGLAFWTLVLVSLSAGGWLTAGLYEFIGQQGDLSTGIVSIVVGGCMILICLRIRIRIGPS